MKKLIFSILFFTISFTFFGQTTFNRLEDYFGTNGRSSNFIQAELSFNNNYYYSLGIYDTLQIFYYCMIKADNQGNEIDRFVFKNPKGLISEYPGQTLISTSDSNIMICANLVDSSWAGYLIKLNTDLDTLWTKIYDMPVNLCGCSSNKRSINYFTAIKETPDKGFIIAGNYYKYCVNNNINLRSFLLKVDSLGNVEWWKIYQNVRYLYDIEITDDGGYVFINKYGKSKFTKTDSLGNILWYVQANNYTNWAEASDITPCGNNEYIVALPYEYQSQKYGINAYKVNLNTQQILWDTTYYLYHSVQCISLNQVMGVEVNNSGDIIVWATSHVVEHPYGGGKRAAVLKLNSQGDSLWAKYYNSPNCTWDDELQINDLIITDDGGFMGVGYQFFYNTGKVMAWLFKTDANGTIGWQSPPAEPSEVRAFPNPARDAVHIRLPAGLPTGTHISVYNAVGQLVARKPVGKGQPIYTLDLQGLKPGLYFFDLSAEGVVIGSGKLAKE